MLSLAAERGGTRRCCGALGGRRRLDRAATFRDGKARPDRTARDVDIHVGVTAGPQGVRRKWGVRGAGAVGKSAARSPERCPQAATAATSIAVQRVVGRGFIAILLGAPLPHLLVLDRP
jgi:hypothetical protein